MKRLLLLVLLLSVPLEAQKLRLRFSPVQQAGGSFAVTSVTGTLTHGSSVTVGGAAFGTKSTAAPLKYDNFQNLTTGQDLSVNGWTTAGGIHPRASTARVRAGTPYTKNALSEFDPAITFENGGDSSGFILLSQHFVKGYVDAWFFSHVVSGTPGNQKPIRWHEVSAGQPNIYFNMYVPASGDTVCGGRDGMIYSDTAFCDTPQMYENWRHLQYLVDIGSGTSAADGTIQVWIDGALVYDHPSVPVWSGGVGGIPELYLGNYLRTDEGAGLQNFWESVYVDNAWARVEIGNNIVYASCTQREIQIPSAWSATSITVTLNRGSFASLSGKYLFVVTSAGTASAGFLLP